MSSVYGATQTWMHEPLGSWWGGPYWDPGGAWVDGSEAVINAGSDTNITLYINPRLNSLTFGPGWTHNFGLSKSHSNSEYLNFAGTRGYIDSSAVGSIGGRIITIGCDMVGTDGVTLNAHGDISKSGGIGNAWLRLDGYNGSLKGGIYITSGLVGGGFHSGYSSRGFGSNIITLTNGGGLASGESSYYQLNINNAIVVGPGGGTLRVCSSYGMSLSGAITGSTQINRTDSGTLYLTGNLSGYNGTFDNQNGTTYFQTGTNILTGNLIITDGVVCIENTVANSYGTVILKGGSLRIKSNNGALGVTPLAVEGNATLGTQTGSEITLNNNITIGDDHALNLDTGYANITLNGTITGLGNLAKVGSGTLTISGTNTYSGATTMSAGSGMLVIQGQQSLSPNTTVILSQSSNSSSHLSLKMDGTGIISLPNTLTINHQNAVLGINITVGNNGSGTGSTIAFNKLNVAGLNDLQGRVGIGSINGNNGYRLQFSDFDLPAFGFTSLGTWTFAFQGNTAPLTLAGTIQQVAGTTGFATQSVLELNSFTTGNLVSGDIKDAADFPTNALTKALRVTVNPSYSGRGNAGGEWTLTGNNSFSGGLTLSGQYVGTQLNINSATALGTGTFTIFGGNNAKFDNTSGSAITLNTNNPQTWSNDFVFGGSSDLNMGAGAVSMGATRLITVTAGTLTVGGVISGSGFGLTKAGNGTLTLGGTNIYTGVTSVNGGILMLQSSGSLAAGSAVSVNNGGTFGGTGTVNGTVTVASGGTLSPGLAIIGSLAINNTLALSAGSITSMEISKAGGMISNDRITGLTGVTYGGTLRVSLVGGTPDIGDKFVLFSKSSGSYSGWFTTLELPTLPRACRWSTMDLLVDGSISVADSATSDVLFADNFNRTNDTNLNTATFGKSGILGALNWTERAVDATAVTVDVSSNTLRMNDGTPLEEADGSAVWLNHNFTGLTEFTVSVDVAAASSTGESREIGIGIGQTVADLNAMTGASGSRSPADIYVGYDSIGATTGIRVWENGTNVGYISSGGLSVPDTLSVKYRFANMNAGTPISYTIYVNGVEVTTRLAIWSGTDENYISLQTNYTSDVRFDNFQVTGVFVPTNYAPAWVSNPITKAGATEGGNYSASLAGSATDRDDDLLTYALVSPPTWLNVAADGTLSGKPSGIHVGPNSFIVSVTDSISKPVQAILIIDVIADANANYTVTYDGNGAIGGSAPVDANTSYLSGSTVTVLAPGDLTKTSYTFSGWNTAADGSGSSYAEGNTFAIQVNTTLYAQWTGNPYSVTFDANGGSSVSPGSLQVIFGSAYGTLPMSSREGYSMTGWFTDPSGGTQVTASTTVTTAADQTLYAQWNAVPVVNAGTDVNKALTNIAWSPLELNPSLWLDASTATINGGTVSIVNAGSGGGTISGPAALAENGIGTLQAVQFNGSSQYLTGNYTNTGTTLTAFFVGKSLNSTQTPYAGMMAVWANAQLNDYDNIGSAVLLNQNNTTANSIYSYRNSTALSSVSGTLTTSFLAATNFNSSTNTVFLNGTAATGVASSGSFNAAKVSLGARWTSPGFGNYWNGNFGEAIICNTSLSASDRQKIEGYLAHKWGLTASLPAAHPYKSGAPLATGVVATLDGAASDPQSEALITEWSVLSGPASVTFTDASAVNTTATFRKNGVYTLRLTAYDAFGSTYDDCVITVSKGIPTVSSWPTAGVILKGQALSEAILNGGSASMPGSFSYDAPSVIPPVGNYTADVTFTPTDTTNYDTVAGTVDVTVLIAVPNVLGLPQTTAQSNITAANLTVGTITTQYHPTVPENCVISQSPIGGSGAIPNSAVNLVISQGPLVLAVTFDANGGSTPSITSKPVIHDAAYGPLATTERTGYSFKGWFTSAAGGTQVTGSTVVATASDHTLYAQWNAIPIVNAGSDQLVTLLGAAWTPAQLMPQLWLDATTATINAGNVSIVNAGSGGGTISGPAALAANGIGTLQAVQFNGSSQYLTGSYTNTGTTLTAFFVGKSLNSTQTPYAGMMAVWANAQLNDWSNIGSAVLLNQNNTTANSLYSYRNSTALSSVSGTLTSSFLAATNFNGSTNTVFLNGTAATGLASSGSFNAAKVSLGGRWTSPGFGNYWNGNFGEAIICNTSLNASDRQKIEGYLAHKWGLAGSLPADHPYKIQSPTIPAVVNINGTVSDLEGDPLTTLWTKVSGPGSVSFGNANAVDTTASFTVSGTYILRLTASDANGSGYDDCEVRVTYLPTVTSWPTAASIVEGQPFSSATMSGGSASVEGSFSYNSPSVIPAAGDYDAAVTFTPVDTTSYNTVSGTVSVTVKTAFAGWAGEGKTFMGDSNGDGLADGIAWLLGATTPDQNATDVVPPAVVKNGDLEVNFRCLRTGKRGSAVLRLQYSKDLGVTDSWSNHTVTVPPSNETVDGVVFAIKAIEDSDFEEVQATIPASKAGGGGKIFMRLSGEMVSP